MNKKRLERIKTLEKSLKEAYECRMYRVAGIVVKTHKYFEKRTRINLF